MDDLYNNAWGESAQVGDQGTSKITTAPSAIVRTTPSALDLKPSWLSANSSPIGPSHAVEDNEADLAAPSWSTGAGILWNEPSEDSHGFGWSHTEPDMAWGASTYDSLQIGKRRQTIEPVGISAEKDSEPVTLSPPSTTTSIVSEIEEEEQLDDAGHTSQYQSLEEPLSDAPSSPAEASFSPPSSDGPLQTPVPTALPSRSSSPDGFGGFSSGFEEVVSGHFKAGAAGDFEDDTWGSAWAATTEETSNDGEEEVEDKWTAAQRRQEDFSRRVPPEFVDDIRKRCQELCDIISPEVNSKDLDPQETSFRNNLQATLDDMDELPAIKHEYLPELILQPPLKFQKTATFKGMSTALKLTRNLPMVKDSPMSHYLASKGSTAWETAIRGRKEIVEEDVVPIGWRILEKDAQKPIAAPIQKPSSRMFAFWGKKESKPTNVPTGHTASASEGSSKSSVVERARSSSERRNSTDSVRSTSSLPKADTSVSPPSVTPSSPISSAPITTEGAVSPLSASPPPPPPPSTTSYADAPIADLDGTEAPPAAAPSAVSRFLNRFARRKSFVPSPSPRQSLALSSDDLEFLSDIVPSVSNEIEEDQKALSAVLHPEMLPPLLAPPSSTPFLPPSLTSDIKTLSLQPPPSQGTMSSYDSFFNVLESPPSSHASGSFPLLGGGTSPIQPSPSIASSSRPQSPASLPPPSTKPITPSPLSAVSAQPFGLPPPPAPRAHTPVLTSAQKQPFAIPPPPSSRSLTPTSSSPPSRPGSSLSHMERSTTMFANRVRPKIPSEIGIPPPPSSSSSLSSASPPISRVESARPATPTSSVPLALLYPNAVNPRASSDPSFGASLPIARNHTPLPPPTIALQPLQSVISSTSTPHKPLPPRVLTSFDNDDDDFADFQSSTPSLIQKPMSVISESSYASPSNQSPSSATNAPMLTGLGPLKASLYGTSTAVQKAGVHPFFKSAAKKPKPLSFDSFEDEFSAFASSSPQIDSSQNTSFDTSGSSLLPTSRSGFDGFSSLSASPALRTPSPPKPPAKKTPVVAQMTSPSPTRTRPDAKAGLLIAPPPPPNASRATRHQHTLSLMELANSRKGKVWPAPPSPLPEALVPPPGEKTTSTAFDFMEDDDSFGSFKTTSDPEGILASNSSPATFGQPLIPSSSTGSNGVGLLPRPGLGQSQSASSAGSGQWLMGSGSGSVGLSSGSGSLHSVGDAPAGVNGKGGALSAQDLSFFEAL